MSLKSNEVSLKWQPARSTSSITLSWKDISVWGKKEKNGNGFWTARQYEHIRILNKVSGFVSSGTLMAIMGASGAGKTTLMATISQRVKGTDTVGDVLVNGRIISKEMMSRLSGFVPQNELVTKTLTVQEHMRFMARLMMDTRVTESQRNRRISSLLSELGLTKTAYTELGELSGGELKRVSLAVQLLTDPVLLFCDEPTTGLDSYNAGIVVDSLRSFASRGKAVICTIHQPASGLFDMFHRVLLLASGRVAFHGSVEDATSFFESLNLRCPVGYNQAEFYVTQLATGTDNGGKSAERIARICDHFDGSKYGEALKQQLFDGVEETMDSYSEGVLMNVDDDLLRSSKEFQKYASIQKVSWGTQLYWLVWRSRIDMQRSRADTLIRFGLYMCIALLLALPYIHIASGVDQKNIQNVEGLMYLIITETVFTFAYSVFHTFPEEIPQLLREIGNGLYKPSPYYIGKIVLSIPGAIIMPLAYTTLIFWVVGLQGGFSGYVLFCIPVIASAIAATAYGYAMSAVFESVAIAALVSVPIDFVCIVFSGIFINLSNLPLHLTWMRYMSPFYFGTEAISILQWSNVQDIKCNTSPKLPCIRTGQQVLEKYGFDANGFYFDLLGLACYYVVVQFIGYVGFWRRSKRESIY